MDETDTINALDHLWNFTPERMYMLVAIARSKENEEIRATNQPTMRKMVEDREELEDKIAQLSHATSRFDNQYRLYGTVNGRNARDGLHFLQKEALDATRKGEKSKETPRLLKRVDHKWKSILHETRCRDEKRFLWDIDDPSEEARDKIQDSLRGMSILTRETPNGWHIITTPFNFTNIEEYDAEEGTFHGFECERKQDDMVFLGFFDS